MTAAAPDDARRDGPPILVVECGAHRRKGHHAVVFAELATALRAAGEPVVVLTSDGWLLESADDAPPLDLRRLGRVAGAAYRWAAARRDRGRRPGVRALGGVVADVVAIGGAARLRRRLGADEVVVITWGVDVYLVSALARRGRWLVYQFFWPGRAGHLRSRAGRRLEHEAAALAARRRRAGTSVRVAVSFPAAATRWRAAAPWSDPVAFPFMAAQPDVPRHEPGTTEKARAALGLDLDARYALLFGGAHAAKDWDVVFRATQDLGDVCLVVAGGGAADGYRAWAAVHGSARIPPVLIEGYVSSETRDRLHAAVDVAVLSFVDGSEVDSGTLVSAVAAGVPIVCSRRCFAAGYVERLELGALFEPGDADSLRAALRAAPRVLAPDVTDRARAELAPARMAEQVVAALRGADESRRG